MPRGAIIIPCRNEEKFIAECLRGVLAMQCANGDEIEVLVMDGMSSDLTAEIVARISNQDPRVRLHSNPGRIQSTALNRALQLARGEWIMRLDAHSFYPPEYLRLCVETAQRTGADNVGGLFITQRGGESYQATLVQALTTHKFGVGDSGFRTGMGEGTADTVPYGFYRRELFDRIGMFDERLVRAQDYEFNRRIIAAGGKVWRNPRIQVHYYNQPTLWAFYRKQVILEAPYNAYLWYVAPYAFALRHAITGVFAAGFLGGLVTASLTPWLAWPFATVMALYALLAIASALQQAVRYRHPLHAFSLPICFFLYHFIHGLGVLYGLLRLVMHTAPVQKITEPWPGAGCFRINARDLRGKLARQDGL